MAAAGRHLDWVLAQQDARTGWFDLAGFSASDHAARVAVTHTIAYTIAGVLHLGIELERPDAVAAAQRAAAAVAGLLERSRPDSRPPRSCMAASGRLELRDR